ncbi:MAG: glycoside hydrolase family 43 protein [Sphingobacteriales bacterium]|nr:glycoside hydrolase family 43 protein [Sphingobacteriales bacterium]
MLSYIKKYIILTVILTAVFLFPFCGKKGGGTVNPPPPPPAGKTFTNPIINGSDPWVFQKDGFYYYTQTSGNKVALWKTTAITKVNSAVSTTIFSPTGGTANSSNIWAPEIHFLDGKWYAYYTAGSGPDETQRTWVLENSNADPTTGTWVDKGRIFTTDADFWAIDGTVLEYNGSKYFLWSGRPNPAVQNQNIYIAKMINAFTLQSPATMLSKPELSWEINGGPVNEGPEILKNKDGKVFLIYSASGCWTDDYALGMLTLKDGGDPLILADWTKNAQPVFTKKPDSKAFGPGHNSFFKSPDAKEDWIIYHANTNSNEGCGDKRNVRIQKFTWNADGTPNFGVPVATGLAITVPSGE